jgi:DnaK suppressor protein
VSASPDRPDDEDGRAAVLGPLRVERARVLARVAALEKDFHDIVERSSDASRDDEHDPEGATIAFERAQVSALLAAARAQLLEIDAAEARIERGEHDRCERCGAGIPAERRSARPTARTCVRCAG